MYAHYTVYTRNGVKVHQVLINTSPKPVGGTTYTVSGKREADALAKQHNAKPWNF